LTLAAIAAALRRLFAPPGIRRMIAMGDLLTASWISQGISVAARLRIADSIGAAAVPVGRLAQAAQCDEDSLYRLLRMLGDAGVFVEQPDRCFGLTRLGELLRSDHPNSMRAFAAYLGEPWHWQAWGGLEGSVRTGEPAPIGAAREPLFTYLAGHPDAAAAFDAAMADLSNARDMSAVASYDFSRFNTLVDVGGGEGQLVRSVLRSYQDVRGVLYDLPQVIARAQPIIDTEGLAARCRLVAGSFFESVPEGGDAYALKQVLHDWPDDRATAILANCRRVMKDATKLLVIEVMMPELDERGLAKLTDLEMLVLTGGRERTLAQYQALLSAAGLRVTRTVATRSPFTIIEASAAIF
jgi:hypothetical protein